MSNQCNNEEPSYQELVEAIIWWDKVAHSDDFSDDEFEVATAALVMFAKSLRGLG